MEEPKKYPTYLISLSGGLDSTYCLYDFLKNNPDKKIVVHHINLRHNAEDRLEVEKEAVKRILDWLRGKKLNNFIYHESSWDYGSLPRIAIKDIQIVSLFAAVILKTHGYQNINKIILSWHKGEVNREDINRGFRVKAMLKTAEVDRDIELLFPIEFMTRREMIRKMPNELVSMVRSCRHPKPNPCENCKTCNEYIAEGLTPL